MRRAQAAAEQRERIEAPRQREDQAMTTTGGGNDMSKGTRTSARAALETLRVACLVAVAAGMLACSYDGGVDDGGDDGSEVAANTGGGFIDPNSGANSLGAFQATVYPLLTEYCSECHTSGPGSPLIAHSSPDAAFQAVVNNQKANLGVPANSRLVRRLVSDLHHCWSNCDADGAEMTAAITEWSTAIQADGAVVTAADGLESYGLRLDQGIEDTGAERVLENLIALFEFKTGAGSTAYDTSGIDPPMHLHVSPTTDWLSAYGLEFNNKRDLASAAREPSRKLYDRIAKPNVGTQQYSIEAWVVPGNTFQVDKPIITYSESREQSNFTLGQEQYNYDYRNRTLGPEVQEDGSPALTTYDADEDLQDRLQHVVITYDQFNGRRIYVDAIFTDDIDEVETGRLWNWASDYHFTIGNEWEESRGWHGQVRLVAIYDHALNQEQIQQNFNAGVGKRVLLRYDVSGWTGPGSFLEFTVSELDGFSYLLCQPTFITPNPSGFRLANLRIAVNGQVAVSGQAFPNIDTAITLPKQELSRQCSVIAKDLGPDEDAFSVTFEAIGNLEDPPDPPLPPPPPPPLEVQDLPRDGVRDYARLNEAMAAITTVDPNLYGITDTATELEQQLPSNYDLRAFSASHQVGIAKLALEYCNVLVDTESLRTPFFGAVMDFTVPVSIAYGTSPMRDRLIDPLLDRILGEDLESQPDPVEVRQVLYDLIDELTLGCDDQTCGAERTRTVAKAACASVLSSAAVSMH